VRTGFPAAIREDHTPFAFLGLLQFIRWTDYRCPHCMGVFRRDFWPYNVRLGSGMRTCSKCGKAFDDGAREWSELKSSGRWRYFLPPGLLSMAGSCLFCGIGALVVAPSDQVNWLIGTMVIGGSLMPTLVWCMIRLPPIRRSIHRYRNEPR
jgi:hypothetical protein